MRNLQRALSISLLLFGFLQVASANELNLYSSRHYQTDEQLYSNFTAQTGIKINRIEAAEDPLIERIRTEGAQSPADVLITVDAGRLWRAQQLGLFQPVKSAVLDSRIPASFREPTGLWYGFSMRARVIAYDKARVNPAEIPTYESLADPKWKGKICVRSSSHIYNLSLLAAMIEKAGEAKATEWAQGVKTNLAREPKGGDTDQIKAIAAGECEVALVNHYYYARLARSSKADEQAIAQKVGVLFPNKLAGGTHVNISGAGVLKNAPNKANAVKFLEYLASDDAQRYFADGNNEWPVVPTVTVSNPALTAMGVLQYDATNISALGRNQPLAQKIYDKVQWK